MKGRREVGEDQCFKVLSMAKNTVVDGNHKIKGKDISRAINLMKC